MNERSNDENDSVDTENPELQQNDQASEEEAPEEFRMSLQVDIENVGPCRKHVRLTVPRADIDHFYDNALGELAGSANVPGFRVGRVPKKLVERRFRKELADQVKQKVLVESLEQVAEDKSLDPINEPNIDVESIELPEEGDFEFEFDVEVRPEFELPDYKGLKIKRPSQEITDDEVDAYLERFLSQYGQLVPHDGPAEPGDSVTCSVEFYHNSNLVRKLDEFSARLKPVLRFQDAELEGFDDLLAGATPGETRETDITISQGAAALEMRGESVQAKFHVKDVKRFRPPELNKEFFQRIGVESEDDLHVQIRETLERQALYQQRQAVREQVLDKITESADWDLPEELVSKQVENAVRREILEMAQAGFTTQEIQARENEIRQKSITSTQQALKEHFVLDKIADRENIEVVPSDIDLEIQMMAFQRGESPRRVRARLEKSGMIENLEAQIRERKAVDSILQNADYEEIDKEPLIEDRIEPVRHSICATDLPTPPEEEETE